MRKGSQRTKDLYTTHQVNRVPKRKQFVVDPSRLEIDQYMLKQIKKNKQSVKSLNKEVISLKKEIRMLQAHHHDYLHLERVKAPDQSQSQVTSHTHRSKKQIRIAFTQQPITHFHSKTSIKSKESSILSISSSKSSRTGSPALGRNGKKPSSASSKQRLNRKIEELKARAMLQSTEKQKIKNEVKQKINNICGKAEKNIIQTPTREARQNSRSHNSDYDRLLELLQTNKSSNSLKKNSVTQSPNEGKESPQKQSITKVEDEQKAVSVGTLQSTAYMAIKSSRTFHELPQSNRVRRTEDNNFSQSNLLESSPSKLNNQSPKTDKRKLKLSRCMELRIGNDHLEASEGSCFEGLFGAPVEMRSGTVQMSFEASDSSKKRLRELQFEFDQLVRQQLMSSDPREKEMLGQTIRSVLWSITELKGKLERESR